MRYFYRDPLSAAWMAKHFGVCFCDEHIEEILWPWDHICDEQPETICYCVHPDSLPIFEPKVGDIVHSPAWGDAFFTIKTERDLFAVEESKRTGCVNKIILRNGIPFHWPEVEA